MEYSKLFRNIQEQWDEQGIPRYTSWEECAELAKYIEQIRPNTGSVLECGTSFGFSTSCLSHVCAKHGIRLYVADSFQGLPTSAGGYIAGQFKCSILQWDRNVHRFGNRKCVYPIIGWFKKTLQGWQKPISLLWLDVDLKESVNDVLSNVKQCLKTDVIFAHECLPAWFTSSEEINKYNCDQVWKELARHFPRHRAKHLVGYLGRFEIL